jgi:hypothetical protein
MQNPFLEKLFLILYFKFLIRFSVTIWLFSVLSVNATHQGVWKLTTDAYTNILGCELMKETNDVPILICIDGTSILLHLLFLRIATQMKSFSCVMSCRMRSQVYSVWEHLVWHFVSHIQRLSDVFLLCRHWTESTMSQLGTCSLPGVAIYGNSTRRYRGYYWIQASLVIF